MANPIRNSDVDATRRAMPAKQGAQRGKSDDGAALLLSPEQGRSGVAGRCGLDGPALQRFARESPTPARSTQRRRSGAPRRGRVGPASRIARVRSAPRQAPRGARLRMQRDRSQTLRRAAAFPELMQNRRERSRRCPACRWKRQPRVLQEASRSGGWQARTALAAAWGWAADTSSGALSSPRRAALLAGRLAAAPVVRCGYRVATSVSRSVMPRCGSVRTAR
jgi:hypothetical protein